jgi:hypothetical protein
MSLKEASLAIHVRAIKHAVPINQIFLCPLSLLSLYIGIGLMPQIVLLGFKVGSFGGLCAIGVLLGLTSHPGINLLLVILSTG